jgi:carboxyl-terminal processing protease
MNKPIRSSLLALLLSLPLACSQGATTGTPGTASSTATTANVQAQAPIAAVPAPVAKGNTPPTLDEEIEFGKAEKFTDGARSFSSVKEMLAKKYYDAGISEDELYRAAVQGMLEHVDPKMKRWNKLLSPSKLAALHSDLEGKIVGVGIEIDFDPDSGYTDVRGTMPGSPAEKAGLVAGDKIVSIGGKLYKGKTIGDVIGDIRGKAGDPVTFTVLRGDKLIPFTLAREVVAYDEVTQASLGDGVGYVHVRSFTSKSTEVLRASLEEIKKRGDVALVIDLRDNQGGSFEAAVAMADMLLPAGTGIVTVKKRDSEEKIVSKATAPLLQDLPIVVLVSHVTASGGELVTAALQEGRKAQVVGARTFGKWTVQSIDELENGYAIKYTLGLFQTPSGRSFEGTGLTPDIEVDMAEGECGKAMAIKDPKQRLAIDVQLRTAVALLKPR